LEVPVFQKHRFLAEMKVWLREQPEVTAAMMSGSGSTMMAVLRSGEDDEKTNQLAESLLQRARSVLDPNLWGRKVVVCEG